MAEKITVQKCSAAICDASTYLQTIADMEKRFKVIRRIESCSMQMMQNPAYGLGKVRMPGVPEQIPGVFIAIIFIYEETEVKLTAV